MKEARAFALSPLLGACLGAFISWASGGFPRIASVAIFYLLCLYGLQVVFGFLIRAVLLKTARVSLTDFILGGFAMIAIPTIPYFVWVLHSHTNAPALVAAVFAIWSIMGAITGACYWWLTRPDKQLRVVS